MDLRVRYDDLDGFWEVVDEDDTPIRGPFKSEQDAHDWLESFGDDY